MVYSIAKSIMRVMVHGRPPLFPVLSNHFGGNYMFTHLSLQDLHRSTYNSYARDQQ